MKDGKYVVLYIDDDRDYRDAVRAILEANGYIMEEAQSAEDGLKAFRVVDPDLMIVDLMMEEVDAGVQFVKEIRASGNAIPIYLLSSVGDHLNATTSYEALGLAGVFQKPVNGERLLAVLDKKLRV